MFPNPEIREVTFSDYFNILKKRLWIIILLLGVIPLVTTIYVFMQTPLYRATASILIEPSIPKLTRFESGYQETEDYKFFQTQYNILTSRALSEKVADDLRLSKEMNFSNINGLAGIVRGKLKVEPVKSSNLVLIHIVDSDPLKASFIANAYARAYIQQDVDTRNRVVKEASVWLESQIEDVKNKMRESEEALNKYIQENRIVATPDIEKKTESLLENLKQTKSRLETDLAESSKRYKQKHPKVIALNAQLEDINKKIEAETNNLLDLNNKMVQYNLLKKEVESNQQLYTSMLGRVKETNVSEKIESSRIRVIDYAKPPSAPFKPNKGKSVKMSIIFALLLGLSLSFFLEYLDSSIRTSDDVSSYLKLPFLGYIPSIHKEAKNDSERALISWHKPQSTITESYRALRTSILFASPEDRPLKNVLITSSLPQEGKSFVSSNLSIVFSQVNERIILIDVDMRRPKIHKNFSLENKEGLSNFLVGDIELEKIIRSTNIPNLSIITAGVIPPNPSELLSSGKIRLLLDELKGKFDRVVLDSPPILSVADTSLLAKLVDGIVLVIKGGSTRLEATVGAKKKLTEAKGNVIGVVINNIEPEKEDKYYYYHYYYSQEGQDKKKKII